MIQTSDQGTRPQEAVPLAQCPELSQKQECHDP